MKDISLFIDKNDIFSVNEPKTFEEHVKELHEIINDKSKSEFIRTCNIISKCVDIAIEFGHNTGREVEYVNDPDPFDW